MKKNKKSSNKSYVFEGQEKDIFIRRLVQKIVDQLYINPEGVRERHKTYNDNNWKPEDLKHYVEYNHNKLSRIRRFLNKNLKIIFSNKSLEECYKFYEHSTNNTQDIVDPLFRLYNGKKEKQIKNKNGKEEKQIQNKDVINAAFDRYKKKYNLL